MFRLQYPRVRSTRPIGASPRRWRRILAHPVLEPVVPGPVERLPVVLPVPVRAVPVLLAVAHPVLEPVVLGPGERLPVPSCPANPERCRSRRKAIPSIATR